MTFIGTKRMLAAVVAASLVSAGALALAARPASALFEGDGTGATSLATCDQYTGNVAFQVYGGPSYFEGQNAGTYGNPWARVQRSLYKMNLSGQWVRVKTYPVQWIELRYMANTYYNVGTDNIRSYGPGAFMWKTDTALWWAGSYTSWVYGEGVLHLQDSSNDAIVFNREVGYCTRQKGWDLF